MFFSTQMSRKTSFVKQSQYVYHFLLNSLGLSSDAHINTDLHVALVFVITAEKAQSSVWNLFSPCSHLQFILIKCIWTILAFISLIRWGLFVWVDNEISLQSWDFCDFMLWFTVESSYIPFSIVLYLVSGFSLFHFGEVVSFLY